MDGQVGGWMMGGWVGVLGGALCILLSSCPHRSKELKGRDTE